MVIGWKVWKRKYDIGSGVDISKRENMIFFQSKASSNCGKACIFSERDQYEGNIYSDDEKYDRYGIVVVKNMFD